MRKNVNTILPRLLLPLCILVLLIGCSSPLLSFGKKTVVQTIPSPSGTYYAQVIDDDQGALGGNTVVKVYSNSNLSAASQTIYTGQWGEHLTMEIYWENDNCLVINGIQYKIQVP